VRGVGGLRREIEFSFSSVGEKKELDLCAWRGGKERAADRTRVTKGAACSL
jgi:hypothetical protein